MVRVRFAPSPTGIPHIGNTRTALYNYLFAKASNGKFIVRIEDTDRERLVPDSLDKILEILKFIGLNWDEGPHKKGKFGPYIQSERLSIYQDYAHKLVKKNLAYYCFCSKDRLEALRQKLEKEGKLTCYDRHCLNLQPSEIKAKLVSREPYVIRLKVPDEGQISWQDLVQGKIEFNLNTIDDQVLLKSDGYPTYHLGVVVDDHLMAITHILRGSEWISSTPKHLLIYQAFGWQMPQIGHFPVILGPDKSKLSKRHGAKSALEYRDEGYLPEALISFMAYLGWSYKDNSELLSLSELVKYFDLHKVQQSNPIFDIAKLNYFNGKAIRQKPDIELVKLLKPFIPRQCSPALTQQILPLIKDRLVKLSDFEPLTAFFYRSFILDKPLLIAQSRRSPQDIAAVLSLLIDKFNTIPTAKWETSLLESIGHQLVKDTHWSIRELFMTLRVAVTGKVATPPLFDTLKLLGKSLTLERLKYAQTHLK